MKKPFEGRCGCGKLIVFAKLPDGSDIPLDSVAPVYRVKLESDGKVSATRDKSAMVSHFATCPHAGLYSSGR